MKKREEEEKRRRAKKKKKNLSHPRGNQVDGLRGTV